MAECPLYPGECNCQEFPHGVCKCGCGKPIGTRGCTGHSKQKRRLCGQPPSKGHHVCRFQGGESLRGPAHPRFIHGRTSSFLPERFRPLYLEALNDPERFTFTQNVALLQTILGELFSQLSGGSSVERWKAARAAIAASQEALETGDLEKVNHAFAKAQEIVTREHSTSSEDRTVRLEIVKVLGEMRKTVQAEHRRQASERDSVSREMMAAAQARVADILTKTITDPVVLRQIAAELEAEVSRWVVQPGHRLLNP